MDSTIERSLTHATFVIDRDYRAPIGKVWNALSDNDSRRHWFSAGEVFTASLQAHDFSVGGHGIEEGQWHGGPRSRFHSTYTDIVELERIVFTYDMWVDDRHMSTSLTTIALTPEAGGTHLTYTEQGVHFDGLDDPAGREEGTRGLLDQLARFLDSTTSGV